MTKSEFAGLIAASLLVSLFLGLLVFPAFFMKLEEQRGFEREIQAGNYDRAEEFIEKYSARHPDSFQPLVWKRLLYTTLERYDQALLVIEQMIKEDPGNPDHRLRKTYVLTRIDKPDEVLEAIKEYTGKGGISPLIHAYAGWAYFRKKEYEKAADEYELYLATNPGDPMTLLALAEIAFEKDDINGAHDLCKRSLAGNPDYEETKKLLIKIETSPKYNPKEKN